MRSIEEITRAIAPIRPRIVVNASMERGLFPNETRCHHLFGTTVADVLGLGRPPLQRRKRLVWRLNRLLRSVLAKLHRSLERSVGLFPAHLAMSASERLARLQLVGRRWPDLDKVIDEAGLDHADHVVIPTADPDLVLELMERLAARSTRRVPSIHARFLTTKYSRGYASLSYLFKRVGKNVACSTKFFPYVETPRMQRAFNSSYGVKPDLFPHLLNIPTPPFLGCHRRVGNKQLTFGFLGNARTEKGFNRLWPIIRGVVCDPSFDRRKLGFLIQVNASAGKTKAAVDELLEATSHLDISIKFHHGPATSSEYDELFRCIDCLLLPYDSDRYRWSSSGILIEALLHGKPFICSAGLSFSDYARAGNALEAEDDAAFACAILRIADDPAAFLEAAQRNARAYGAELRGNVLVQRLLQPTT